jgi:hypothetical protein
MGVCRGGGGEDVFTESGGRIKTESLPFNKTVHSTIKIPGESE